jgi:hypothetical protein
MSDKERELRQWSRYARRVFKQKDDMINDYEHKTIGVFNQNDDMINDHEYDIVGEFWKKMMTWLNDYEYEGCHNTKHN